MILGLSNQALEVLLEIRKQLECGTSSVILRRERAELLLHELDIEVINEAINIWKNKTNKRNA